MGLETSTRRLTAWMRDAALPFWAGVQEAGGSWPEHLHRDGRVDGDAVRRHRVQARQVYVYGLASRRGWFSGEAIVRSTVDFLWDAGWARDGEPGLIHRLNADGSVASGQRDLYDHAFYLLALGWAEAVVGGQGERLEAVVRFIDGLAHPSGGYREGLPDALPRRQNPHMHLLEACLNLDRLGVAGDWRARADRLVRLFEAHFYDARHGGVREFFDVDWRWDGGSFEPGHAVEWVWLLDMYDSGHAAKHASERDRLYGASVVHGGVWLWDEVDHEHEAVRETSRLWVQTELVKAHLVEARRGVVGARELAAAGLDGLMAEWLEPRGTWVDQRGACGQTISATIPTSTFYHIAALAAVAEDVARDIG